MKSPAIPIPALPKIPVLEKSSHHLGVRFVLNCVPRNLLDRVRWSLLLGLCKGLHT